MPIAVVVTCDDNNETIKFNSQKDLENLATGKGFSFISQKLPSIFEELKGSVVTEILKWKIDSLIDDLHNEDDYAILIKSNKSIELNL